MYKKVETVELFSCRHSNNFTNPAFSLRASRERKVAILKGTRAGIWDWDVETGDCFFSERWAEIVGYTIDELQPLSIKTWMTLCHPDDLKASNKIMEDHFSGKLDYYEIEVRMKRKDGSLIWVKNSGKVIEWNKNKRPLRMCGTLLDITDQKMAEQKLKHRLEMEALVTGISSSFVGIGTGEIDNAINNALERIGRFANVDRAYVFLINPDDADFIDNTHEWCDKGITAQRDNLQNLSCSEFPWWMGKLRNFDFINLFQLSEMPPEASNEKALLRAQGIVSLLVIPIYFKKELLGFMGFDSVLEAKDWLAEDIALLTTVGEIVGSALNHYKNEQRLIIAKEKAEEADRLKTAFLQNLSHEIRTPLNGILGFSDLLGEPDVTDSRRESYINVIHDCGRQLMGIVDNLICISTIESGSEKVNESKLVVNDLIFDLMTLNKPKAKISDLNMYVSPGLSDRHSEIYTDPVKLRQIFTNLIDNALKFTHSGVIEFGYTLEKDYLKFFVRDTGIGIAPRMHSRIFERFRQVEDGSNRKYGGNGLGLAISKAYAELLGGRIWVESSLGKGATFYFTVPFVSVNKDQIIGIDIPKIDDDQVVKTILFVEDEEINYLFFREILSNKGFKLIHASNGEEAVELLRNHSEIDLVLMDIKLPVMNGYEATRQIKTIKREVPVIAQTAYASEYDRAKAIDAGCDDYIVKPINKNDIMAKIKKWIAR
jgi:PAS domain S-box-containing protein